MIKIILNGACGHMGKVIRDIVAAHQKAAIVAGIDPMGGDAPFPIFREIEECDIKGDAVIDFSSPLALDGVVNYCKKNAVSLVECTTGLNDTQIESLRQLSRNVPVLRSANMSLGINILLKLLKENAGALFDSGFDIEIIEKHHNLKKDAPSGTALALADAINEGCGNELNYIYDRTEKNEPRKRNELGISSIRGGSIVGEHQVILAGTDEVIEIKHTAYSKAIFAKGAVAAAIAISNKAPGLYTMEDVV